MEPGPIKFHVKLEIIYELGLQSIKETTIHVSWSLIEPEKVKNSCKLVID